MSTTYKPFESLLKDQAHEVAAFASHQTKNHPLMVDMEMRDIFNKYTGLVALEDGVHPIAT